MRVSLEMIDKGCSGKLAQKLDLKFKGKHLYENQTTNNYVLQMFR